MRETLSCLIQLQQIDNQIHEILRMQSACRTREQELADEIQTKSVVFDKKSELHSARETEHAEKSTALRKEQDKLSKWEKRLMESKNTREASALAREIDTQKRLNTEAEEVVLRLELEEEELRKEVAELRTELDSLKSEYENEAQNASTKASEFDASLTECQAKREENSTQLSKSLFNKYENIKKLRGGVAVVPARNGSCTGCNMRLRPQLYNIILRIQTLETCPSCKRILYSAEGFPDGNS